MAAAFTRTATSSTAGATNPKHFFWAPGQNPQGTIADSAQNDLIYHGGNIGAGAIGVETTPAVYLLYCGPDWATGFQTADTDGKLFSSKTLPGLGTTGCGMHNVNATSDSFGNGIFDGYSIVTGHEYAEAVTDPDNFFAQQDGWNDAQGSENGDKCAWTNTQNIVLGSRQYAVQPMWSNEAFDATGNGCVVSR